MLTKKIFPLFLISVAAVLVAVLQMSLNGPVSEAESISIDQSKVESLQVKYKALSFADNGVELRSSKDENKIVILNFWASWCAPCLSEFESLNKLVETFGKKVEIIGVNNDSDRPRKIIRRVQKERKLKFRSVPADVKTTNGKENLASLFQVKKIPTTLVFYKGKLIKYSEKKFDFGDDEFKKMLKSYIN